MRKLDTLLTTTALAMVVALAAPAAHSQCAICTNLQYSAISGALDTSGIVSTQDTIGAVGVLNSANQFIAGGQDPTGGKYITYNDGRSAIETSPNNQQGIFAFGTIGGPFVNTGNFTSSYTYATPGDYAEWGIWQATDVKGANGSTGNTIVGAYATGTPTPVQSIPNSGSASYSGSLIGQALIGTTPYQVTGTENIAVNWSGTSLASFNLNKTALNTSGTPVGATTVYGTLSGNFVVNHNNGYYNAPSPTQFAGLVHNPSISGTLNGESTTFGALVARFYGPAAQATAGTFQAETAHTFTQAAFGATKH
jgi:hypothetical protein